jgi:hypothetical protein
VGLDQGDDLAGDHQRPNHGAGVNQEGLERAGGDLDHQPVLFALRVTLPQRRDLQLHRTAGVTSTMKTQL